MKVRGQGPDGPVADAAGPAAVVIAGTAQRFPASSGAAAGPSRVQATIQRMSSAAPDILTLSRPDDWHLHVRDGAALAAVVPHTARQFGRAIIMPNLKPPVTTAAQALAYRERILAAVPAGLAFEPLMTLYLTDNMPPEEIGRAKAAGVAAVKLYPAGATTNSDAGVTDLRKTQATLDAMQREGLPLLVHGEVTDAEIDLFDREAVFIDRQLIPLRRDFPALKIVFEHITTREAAQYVAEAGPHTAATITAHHLLYNRNAIFTGGIRPHYYCLPVLKRELHREALVAAATSGSDRYFLGTDSAPHPAHLKEHASGCAGCYTAFSALELYAEAFDAAGALDRLEGFASVHGPAFYGLPRNAGTVTLRRQAWTPPETLPFGEATLKPLRGGESLAWRQVE
ncbi:Dihydroorotase [Methylibium sp. T29]|nr:Dihydroorotase [Methylibium sp. T29]EWS60090.1 Dihydroorotase [Methylibium sp. T29-B]